MDRSLGVRGLRHVELSLRGHNSTDTFVCFGVCLSLPLHLCLRLVGLYASKRACPDVLGKNIVCLLWWRGVCK